MSKPKRADKQSTVKDGGGVRGLTSLLLLQSIFQSIETVTGRKVHPHEYFDLIAGTSTGGLIAIMLGRLRMPIEEAIEAYKKLSLIIFKKKWWSDFAVLKVLGAEMNRHWFRGQNLQDAICNLLSEKQMDPELDLRESESDDARCKIFVCAVDAYSSNVQLLRSYRSNAPGQFNYECSIWEAARATSAAPLFFEPITLRRGGATFVDGAVRANNPVEEAVNEARSLWPDRQVGCLLSLGTGISVRPGFDPKKNSLHAVLASLAKIATDANTKHIAFKSSHYCNQLIRSRRYFRFSVSQGVSDIEMSDFMKLPIMQSATIQYTAEVSKEIEECARQLASWDETYVKSSNAPLHMDSGHNPARKFLTLLDMDWERPVSSYVEDFGTGVLVILAITRILSAYNQAVNDQPAHTKVVTAQLTTLRLMFQTQCFLLLSSVIQDSADSLYQFIYSRDDDPADLLQLLQCSQDQTLALEDNAGRRIWSVLSDYEQHAAAVILPQLGRIEHRDLARFRSFNLDIHALVRSRGHLHGLGPNLPDDGPTIDVELSRISRVNQVSRHLQNACGNLWSCAEHPVHSTSLKLAPSMAGSSSWYQDQKSSVTFDLVLTNSALGQSQESTSFEITCPMAADQPRSADSNSDLFDQGDEIPRPPVRDVRERGETRGRKVIFEGQLTKAQQEQIMLGPILEPLCTLRTTDSSDSRTHVGCLASSESTNLSVQLVKPARRMFGMAMPTLSWMQPDNTEVRNSDRVSKAEKMRFAFQLAKIVLAHHSTPWLENAFSRADVSFWSSSATDCRLTNPFLFQQLGSVLGKAKQTVSEQHTDPWIKNPILFGLGVILLELEYEMPIESIISLLSKHAPSSRSGESLAERLLTVKYSAGNQMGTSYGRIVRMCLDCDFGLGLREYSLKDTMLQRRYYTQIILEFEKLLPQWEKIYSL
ncbi:hypothetical protein PFICI_13932 [Pestalotiopsis fici W106-1]|uniref:PNPLA domain-containing protein n=1 Tax=Pestalotiopsis fici (strain W106-1 / CGMCC3.15140) TaxID=1229662 RepID=W3WMM0_PESFW|nr:uncharacterized protein PFICI_13932 [Pestalotiopsis fici W106-1]ETS74066.1 hypothetical protein PFICI_13932 [Pestalotiopsis fici W106-1]